MFRVEGNFQRFYSENSKTLLPNTTTRSHRLLAVAPLSSIGLQSRIQVQKSSSIDSRTLYGREPRQVPVLILTPSDSAAVSHGVLIFISLPRLEQGHQLPRHNRCDQVTMPNAALTSFAASFGGAEGVRAPMALSSKQRPPAPTPRKDVRGASPAANC